MDSFGRFTAWVGIVSFLLAIPMAVLANVLTPKVISWWSRTNSYRRKRRVATINKHLSETDTEAHALQYAIYMVVSYSFLALCFGIASIISLIMANLYVTMFGITILANMAGALTHRQALPYDLKDIRVLLPLSIVCSFCFGFTSYLTFVTIEQLLPDKRAKKRQRLQGELQQLERLG